MPKFTILAEVSYFRYFVAIDADGYSLEGLIDNATKFDSYELAREAMKSIPSCRDVSLTICGENARPIERKSLHESLAHLRTFHGISKRQIAGALGIDYRVYGHWETGFANPCNDDLVKIADYYSITVDELVKGGRRLPVSAK